MKSIASYARAKPHQIVKKSKGTKNLNVRLCCRVLNVNTQSNWASRLAERWRTRRSIQSGKISCDESGMTVTVSFNDGSVEHFRLNWADVNGVVAYKRDFVYVDEFCLGFSSSDGSLEVNEQMQGWDTLINALPAYLDGLPSPEQWWEKVAQPPFATNVTKLFSR